MLILPRHALETHRENSNETVFSAGSCIEGLVLRNVTVGGGSAAHGWGGCASVDPASAVVESVFPPLKCQGCASTAEV